MSESRATERALVRSIRQYPNPGSRAAEDALLTRIDSLLTEREELREALEKIAAGGDVNPWQVAIDALSVLSSRETTDSPASPEDREGSAPG